MLILFESLIIQAVTEDEILQFENFKLDEIITPIKVKELERLLCNSGYNEEKGNTIPK